jgi:hypothetical protein
LKKYLFILFFLNAIFCFAQTGKYTYHLSITDDPAVLLPAKINAAIGVLHKRLSSSDHKKFTVVYSKLSKEIIVTSEDELDSDFIRRLIKPLKVEFYECYDIAEIKTELLRGKKNTQLIESKIRFLEMLNVKPQYSTAYRNSYIGYVKLSDTAAFNKIAVKLKKDLPSDCTLSYEGKPETGEPFMIYALKNNAHKLPINSLLDSVRMQFDEKGYPLLSINFNREGTEKFALLTEKNSTRGLAIVIDGLVYSAPMVNGKIEHGKVQIAGAFTAREVAELGKMLTGGYLPLHLTIAN